MHLRVIDELRARHAFSYVFNAELPTPQLVRAVVEVMGGRTLLGH